MGVRDARVEGAGNKDEIHGGFDLFGEDGRRREASGEETAGCLRAKVRRILQMSISNQNTGGRGRVFVLSG